MMKDYLDLGETSDEYVRRWWRLADYQAVGFQTLIDELQHSMWEPADLAKTLFRSAGRNRCKQLKVTTEKTKTGKLGEAFAILLKLGFGFTTDTKGILQERFETEEDPEECAVAMSAISEFRPLTIATYREWKERLTERSGKEVMKSCKQAVLIDQEVLRLKPLERREKHRGLLLMRAIEKGIRIGVIGFRTGSRTLKRHIV
jgi:hypothetical protein